MKKFVTRIAVLSAGWLMCSGALAQGYVGVASGTSKMDLDCAGAAVCDESGSAAKLVGGYEFSPGWAGELGFVDFGKTKAADSGVSVSIKAQAVTFGVAYQAQFNPQWGLNLRLGAAQVRAKGSVAGLGSVTDTTTKPYVGVGLNYALSPKVRIELGADFTKGEIEGAKADVHAVTLGAKFSF